jgi:hypothetical protein
VSQIRPQALDYSAHLVGNNLNLDSVEDDAVDPLQLRRHNQLPTYKPRLIRKARPIASLSAASAAPLPVVFFIGLIHLGRRLTRGGGKRFHGPLYRRKIFLRRMLARVALRTSMVPAGASGLIIPELPGLGDVQALCSDLRAQI